MIEAVSCRPVARATRLSTPASPNTTGVHSATTSGSASKRRHNSGPTPAGSPIVTAIRGDFRVMDGKPIRSEQVVARFVTQFAYAVQVTSC